MDKKQILAAIGCLVIFMVAATQFWPNGGREGFNASCGSIAVAIGLYAFIRPLKARKFLQALQPTADGRNSMEHPLVTIFVWLMSIGFIVGGASVVFHALSRQFNL